MANRKHLIGGNWKMQANKAKVQELIKMLNSDEFQKAVDFNVTEVVVAPTFLFIDEVKSQVDKKIMVASQNCCAFGVGAYTGEVSVDMLKDVKCDSVILGHSERRHIYKESDEDVAKKVKIALENGLKVIACVGELLTERESGQTQSVITAQVNAIVDAVKSTGKPELWQNLAIAYEPVWAIGTGKTATPDQAEEIHVEIRNLLTNLVGKDVADSVRIMYGGSVTADNCNELIKKANIDGFLVGGASLKPDFIKIAAAKK